MAAKTTMHAALCHASSTVDVAGRVPCDLNGDHASIRGRDHITTQRWAGGQTETRETLHDHDSGGGAADFQGPRVQSCQDAT